MKKSKLFICFFIALSLVFSLAMPAFAARTKNATTGGNGSTATTMTIKTDKKTTLAFKQTKGKLSYSNMVMGTSYLNTYGDFLIYVVDQSGKDAPRSYTCTFKQSKNITLEANKTYTISITPRAKDVTYRALIDAGKLWYRAPWNNSFSWISVPTWTVTAKNVISLNVNQVVTAPQQ